VGYISDICIYIYMGCISGILWWENDRYMIREWGDIPRLCHYSFINAGYDLYDLICGLCHYNFINAGYDPYDQ
jgi:hypothetical protein